MTFEKLHCANVNNCVNTETKCSEIHILKASEKQYYVAPKNILKEIKQGIINLMILKKWLSNWPGILKEEQNKTFRNDKKKKKSMFVPVETYIKALLPARDENESPHGGGGSTPSIY